MTSEKWKMVCRLRTAAAECGVEAVEAYYLFECYDDVPDSWPAIEGHGFAADPLGWFCEACAAQWVELAKGAIDPTRMVTIADAVAAGQTEYRVREFLREHFNGAESVSVSELVAFTRDESKRPCNVERVNDVLAHLFGTREPKRVYDSESDSPRWCELCGCPLEFCPTDYCGEDELAYWQDHRHGRFRPDELVSMAEMIDGCGREDEAAWLDVGEAALSNLFVPAEKERERRAFSRGRLSSAWSAMRKKWREDRWEAA